jgi:hypothetical protein
MLSAAKRVKVREGPDGEAEFLDADTNDPLTDAEAMDTDPELVVTVAPERAVKTNAEKAINVLLEMTPHKSEQMLRALEKTSTTLRDFVRERNLWRLIFIRDFPRHYAEASVSGQMKQSVKDMLDKYSVNPKREQTYWKRYYELLTRTNLPHGNERLVRRMQIPIEEFSWKDTAKFSSKVTHRMPRAFDLIIGEPFADIDQSQSYPHEFYIYPLFFNERKIWEILPPYDVFSTQLIVVDYLNGAYHLADSSLYQEHMGGIGYSREKLYDYKKNDITWRSRDQQYIIHIFYEPHKSQFMEIAIYSTGRYVYPLDFYEMVSGDHNEWFGVNGNEAYDVTFYRHPDPNIDNIVFAVPDTFRDDDGNIVDDHCAIMKQVDLNAGTSINVAYDEAVVHEGGEIKGFWGTDEQKEYSRHYNETYETYLAWYNYDHTIQYRYYGTGVFDLVRVTLHEQPVLVSSSSSCQQCFVREAKFVEKKLRGLFCSAPCQREYRRLK